MSNMNTKQTDKVDKRAAALRDNLKRRKEKVASRKKNKESKDGSSEHKE